MMSGKSMEIALDAQIDPKEREKIHKAIDLLPDFGAFFKKLKEIKFAPVIKVTIHL